MASPRLVPTATPYPVQIVIADMLATGLVRVADLVIVDQLNEQPNTATLTTNLTPHAHDTAAFHPPSFDNVAFVTTPLPMIYPAIQRGQPIRIYAGGGSATDLVFAGEIVTVQQIYEVDRPAHVAYHLSCTDYTRALNRRKVTKSYLTQSATAIVLDLMQSRIADGFTTAFVQANLPPVAIDFTFEDMNRALTRLANRIGGYWYVDYSKALHFSLGETGPPPAPLAIDGERFADLTFETDLSQVRTRVLVEGAGTTTIAQVFPGETMLPIRDPVMLPASGEVVVGQQRLHYTGVIQGGAGSLVGPGAQPSSAPTAAAIVGAGIEAGTHDYAVTFLSAAGESLPSPRSTVTLGSTDPPLTPPVPQPPLAGAGPDPGVHSYAVTFVTASGETTPSPASAQVMTTQAGGVPAPAASPAALRNVVGNLVDGVPYAYQTTLLTASGESLPGPPGAAIQSAPPAAPGSVHDQGGYPSPTHGGNLQPNASYQYWVSYIIGGQYETALSQAHLVNTINGTTAVHWHIGFGQSSDTRVTGRKIYRSVANGSTPRLLVTRNTNNPAVYDAPYTDTAADASLGAAPGPLPTGVANNQARVTVPTSSDPRALARRIYRSDNGAAFRALATINNVTATEYLDNVASVAGNPDAPTVDTTGGALTCQVPVTTIATGPAAVTGRRLYRTKAGGATFFLVTTIADNLTTTYLDTTPDGTLSAPLSGANTTTTAQVRVTNLPIGSSAVTGRRLYRSAANTGALKLLQQWNDNTTTGPYTDAASDATLGAAAPTLDTSGLQQPAGQVNAGATTLPVAGTAAFSPSGGFAVVGNGELVIRYAGLTPGTALTGIPASGAGSLTSTVSYNAMVTVAAALTGLPASGLGAIVRGIVDGQDVNLLIVRDDLGAQAALAAIEGGDGIIEHYIQDRRLSASGAAATAEAELALFSGPEVRVQYTTRDVRTASGQSIAINLPPPTNLVGTFLIQRVTLSQFDLPGVPPLRTVQASSTRFSFEDVLRRLQLEVYA